MLEENFIKIFRPVYILNTIFCSRKFVIKTNNITTVRKKEIFVSISANALIFVLWYFTIDEFKKIFEPLILYMYIVIYLQYVINFSMLTYKNIMQSKDNVKLILELHKIEQFFYIQGSNKILKRTSLVSCTAISLIYILLITIKISVDPLWTVARGLFIASTLIFDLEIIYAAFVIYHLSSVAKKWNEAVRKNEIDDETKMLEVYQTITHAAHLIKKIFNFTVRYHNITITCF